MQGKSLLEMNKYTALWSL